MSNTLYGYVGSEAVTFTDMTAYVDAKIEDVIVNDDIAIPDNTNNIGYFPGTATREMKISGLLQESDAHDALIVRGNVLTTGDAVYSVGHHCTLGLPNNEFSKLYIKEISGAVNGVTTGGLNITVGNEGVSMSSLQQIHGVADPTAGQDVATKKYVDAVGSSGLTYTGSPPGLNNFPQFTGVGNSVGISPILTTNPSRTVLNVLSDLRFDANRSIASYTVPVQSLYVANIDSGMQGGLTGGLTINSSVITLTGFAGQGVTEMRGIQALRYFPSNYPIVIPRIIYSRCFSAQLTTDDTKKNYITDFPTDDRFTYGTLTIPPILNMENYGSMTWRFDLKGSIYTPNAGNHYIFLGASVSQQREGKNYYMSLQNDNALPPPMDGGTDRTFHLVAELRLPPTTNTRGSLFCAMLMNLSGNYPISMSKFPRFDESENIYYDTSFNINLYFQWEASNNNRIIRLDSCTVTQCCF